ncbi:MAG: hypothetical protein AAF747_08310 [Planctomycetota bacterium]
MIPFFVGVALSVWFPAYHYRRRLAGFGIVMLGLLGLAALAYFHYWASIWTNGRVSLPALQMMLYPYTLLVVAVGVGLACVPRGEPIAIGGQCGHCGYDITALPQHVVRCPECGEHLSRVAPASRQIAARQRGKWASRSVTASPKVKKKWQRPAPPPRRFDGPIVVVDLSPDDADNNADHEHQQRQAGNQQPADRRKSA